jgi:hypothetical protein
MCDACTDHFQNVDPIKDQQSLRISAVALRLMFADEDVFQAALALEEPMRTILGVMAIVCLIPDDLRIEEHQETVRETLEQGVESTYLREKLTFPKLRNSQVTLHKWPCGATQIAEWDFPEHR